MPEIHTKKKICVVNGKRGGFNALLPTMRAIDNDPSLELQVVLTDMHLSETFGKTIDYAKKFIDISKTVPLGQTGGSALERVDALGRGLSGMAKAFSELKPDLILILGDRSETLVAAFAALQLKIPVAHIQGGEVSGTIDEHTRHAITKFCHFHFPATEQSRERIIKLGEIPENVVCIGCPGTDLLLETPEFSFEELRYQLYKMSGQRDFLEKLTPDYLLVVQFPMTTELGDSQSQIEETLSALKGFKQPIVILKPNPDAGGDIVSRCIEKFGRENDNVLIAKHFPPYIFVNLMRQAKVMIGNSSAGIRETGYFGLPTINIGNRQVGRERTVNIIDIPNDAKLIEEEIKKQLEHGRYGTEQVYGDGTACKKIAEIIPTLDYSKIQKKIVY